MKKRLCLLLGLMAVSAFAQEPGEFRTPKPPKDTGQIGKSAVTLADVRRSLDRLVKVMTPVVGQKVASSTVPMEAKPASREVIIREFARLFEAFRPAYKVSPRPQTFDAARLKIGAADRPRLEMLIRMGAVAPIGPLATQTGSPITVNQYGDALGYFMARVADLSHLPTRQFSPNLKID